MILVEHTKMADEVETTVKKAEDTIICYAPAMITTNGVWQGDSPLAYSLPLFILQLTLIVVTTRILVFILKPLRQPRVVSEILGGIILGPSVVGRIMKFANVIFPLRSVMVLETMANVGLLYFLFLVGVEMDISVIWRTGKKAIIIATGGMLLPFISGVGFAMVIRPKDLGISIPTFALFIGAALSVTAFPVLARILADLKLLNTEIGRIAMSSAIVNDMCAWILLAFAIALAENNQSISLASLWVLLSSAGFVIGCVLLVRPAVAWIIRRTPEGESFSDFYVCLILTGVMISGFVTDAIGMHSVFGAFILGVVIPNGPLGVTLIEKLEDFVSGLLLPLFFAISGLKTDVKAIKGAASWGYLSLIVVIACAGKIAGTVVVSYFYNMQLREGLALGLLMNTKGLVEIIVLNVGRDQKVLDDQIFAMLVIAAVIMTGIITPIVTNIYKPARTFVQYKRRTIQKSKPDAELRFLVCVHSPRNVPTIINLLEASHPTRKSPLGIYALHLVELTGRASAMLIVHTTRNSGRPALNRTQAQSDHIIKAFENYEQHAGSVAVQPLTAISPYSTMHEDICSLAEDKRVSLVIIPFHKQQTVDGGMEATNPALRMVNQNVLANAPCSVAVLVDRGLGWSTRLGGSGQTASRQIIVLFFGGSDDREALAYAWRMSGDPATRLTVMRFLPGRDGSVSSDPKVLTVMTDSDRERHIDEEQINDFKMRTGNDESVVYAEKVVSNAEETVAAIRSINSTAHDLYIVGRGQGSISPLTAGLTDWSECPELGAIGDLLASSDFAATVSVLVVQQYVGAGLQGEALATPDSPLRTDEHFGNPFNRRQQQPPPAVRGHQPAFSP